MGSSCDSLDVDQIGSWGPWFPGIGNYPAYTNSNFPGVLYSLKSSKCMFSANTRQSNDWNIRKNIRASLRLERQKRNEEND